MEATLVDITQITREDLVHANTIAFNLHKQAYLGRLKTFGVEPRGATPQAIEKEASALLQLGFDLQQTPLTNTKTASELGDGPYATAHRVLREYQSAPGFENLNKVAAAPGFEQISEPEAPAELPPALVDAAYKVAVQLAHNPDVYRAARIIKIAAAQMNQTAAA
jgi:hypothetical protein